ncbi:MAG TPA: glycosyltransferase family 2 protein [Terriglobales bacterium]|nr:glycosyltransferase family 2 protein [Terriglobales bacterium]
MAPLLLTILCPVYNEQEALPLFFSRLRPVLEQLSGRYQVHLLFLDNASTDETPSQIRDIKKLWPDTYVIRMSRTISYHASLECGLRKAKGDLLVFIDVDCEDPPEMIATFVEHYEHGFDVVYGERVDREEPRMVVRARKLFYRLLRAVADEEIILDMAEFSLFTNEVREAVLEEQTSYPFLRAAIGRVGFRRLAVPFKRQKRIAGTTHYNLASMSLFAIGGILAASTLLLRLPVYLLPAWIAALAGLAIGYAYTHSIWFAVAGFVVFAAYLGATAAFTALYVARTYKNGLRRPNAFMDRKLSILQPASQSEMAEHYAHDGF